MVKGIDWKVEKNNLGEVQGQVRGATHDEVREIMDDILTDVQRRMHIPGTGQTYIHGGITHQASSPGQAPAAEFGDLVASYEVGVAWEGDNAVGIIHSNEPSAAALEYGAPARNLAARPAVTPAGEKMRGDAPSRLSNRLRRLIFR